MSQHCRVAGDFKKVKANLSTDSWAQIQQHVKMRERMLNEEGASRCEGEYTSFGTCRSSEKVVPEHPHNLEELGNPLW